MNLNLKGVAQGTETKESHVVDTSCPASMSFQGARLGPGERTLAESIGRIRNLLASSPSKFNNCWIYAMDHNNGTKIVWIPVAYVAKTRS